jgi:hypothetical protein
MILQRQRLNGRKWPLVLCEHGPRAQYMTDMRALCLHDRTPWQVELKGPGASKAGASHNALFARPGREFTAQARRLR